jgi:hypothetical protein
MNRGALIGARVGIALAFVLALWGHASCSAATGNEQDYGRTGGTAGTTGTGGTLGKGGAGGDGCAGQQNSCGTCEPACKQGGGGDSPFPIDANADPGVKDASGVTLDKNGDLTLDASKSGFNYMWISNTYDIAGKGDCAQGNPAQPGRCRGTLSKIDTVAMKEVARYYTVTCATKTGPTGCDDVNGKPITLAHNHTPSRTAVDYNYDAWVANRSVHGGQPSASKVANSQADCIDRNKNGTIDTSKDHDGDGTINVDCDGDGNADSLSTSCSNGKPPEFLGDDEECILFTTNYADPDDLGRSICLDVDRFNIGPSNAWVGTYSREQNGKPNNEFYEIDGVSGKIKSVVALPKGHRSYGCAVDDKHIVWSTDIGNGATPASMAFFAATLPHEVGPLMRGPSADAHWTDGSGEYHHYGIAIDGNQYVWLGGWTSSWVLRYKPNRASFAALSQGTWTRIDMPAGFVTRGIAADTRGKVWVSVQDGGHILRLEQALPDGHLDLTQTQDYWKLKAQTVIGVGVDMAGHLWGVGHGNKTASRLDVDAMGNIVQPVTGETNNVTIGQSPYTYSDFTGYALMKFLIAQGRYVYELEPCPGGGKANWIAVHWNATTPAETEVLLRVRTGDSDATFGGWTQPFSASPALIGNASATPVAPNPSRRLQVEFTLKTQDKNVAPTLHDYTVGFSCPSTTN